MPRFRLVPPCAAALLALTACDRGSPSEPLPAACGSEAIQLKPGQSAALALAGGEATCRLDAAEAAEYVLAYVDTRALRRAETADEGSGWSDYRVTVATGGATAARRVEPARSTAEAEPPADDVLVRADAAADEPPGQVFRRDRPWTEGETFRMWDPYTRQERPSRVVRVYDGVFVLAVFEGDAPEQVADNVAFFDAAMPLVRAHAVPLLRRAFVDRLPTTSTASGQALWILRTGGVEGASAWASAAVLGDTVNTWLSFRMGGGRTVMGTAWLITHEMTHSYQRMHMHATRPAGTTEPTPTGAGIWGVEGGASLAGDEVVRRAGAIGLQANLDWRNPGSDPARQRHAQSAQPGRGHFNRGYQNSAGFLRDLLVRRVREGDGEDDALREVLRGSVEGWFGIDTRGTRRPGLAERMRARAGNDWRPDDALLVWALSYAADDRTTSPVFQNRVYRQVAATADEVGWQPDAELGAAEAVVATRPYGAPGYVRLRSPGGELRVSGRSNAPDVRWMVLRVR